MIIASYQLENNNIATLSGCKRALSAHIISPAVENSLSDCVLVAGVHNTLLAKYAIFGNRE